jgi:hypothetical protein
MIHVEEGTTITAIFSEKENLTNWSIKLISKTGRTSTSENIPMLEVEKSSRRYYLEWLVPTLNKVEFNFEISADGVIIDKGILRRK